MNNQEKRLIDSIHLLAFFPHIHDKDCKAEITTIGLIIAGTCSCGIEDAAAKLERKLSESRNNVSG